GGCPAFVLQEGWPAFGFEVRTSDCFAIARRMSSPPAKPASPGLASGLGGWERLCLNSKAAPKGRFARGIRGRWFARDIGPPAFVPAPSKRGKELPQKL